MTVQSLLQLIDAIHRIYTYISTVLCCFVDLFVVETYLDTELILEISGTLLRIMPLVLSRGNLVHPDCLKGGKNALSLSSFLTAAEEALQETFPIAFFPSEKKNRFYYYFRFPLYSC